MKKILALVFMLFFAGTSFAFTLAYTDTTINVPVNGKREVQILIRSEMADSFVISPLDTKTWVTYDRTIVQVNANEQKGFMIILSPTSSITPNLYQIPFNVESQSTKESQRVDLFARVFKSEGVEIEKFFVSGELVPGGYVNLKFSVRNIGEAKLQNVVVSINILSPKEKIYDSTEILSVEPAESITLERPVALKENAESGNYAVNIKVIQLDKTLAELNEAFVVAQRAIIKDEIQTEVNLLKKTKNVLVRNVGNAPSEEIVYTEKITKIDSNFYSGDKPSEIQGDVYVWKVPPLQPGQSYTIKYSLDYSPVLYFLVIAGAFAWIYFTKIRTVRISKNILQKKHIREGEEFTVGIEVKNYSGQKVDELEIYDFVPAIFEIKQTEGPKPTQKKSEAGIELNWKINNLAANEERVLSYKIIPVIEISGMIKLPSASVAFLSAGKEKENESNATYIGLMAQGEEPLHHHLQHKLKSFFKKKKD